MSKQHIHHKEEENTQSTLLLWALLLTSSFFIAEAIGGAVLKSLALISDAAHMLTDVIALIIAWAAVKIGQKPADQRRTFGYYRFEILAAAFNTLLLFCVATYILVEAYQRFKHPPEIYSMGMLIIATLGLIINLVSMKLLGSHAHHEHNLNMKSAYLEVWSDMLGSIGVIIGALIIQFTGWVFFDSIVAVLIALWILPRGWVLLKESISILLEAVPKHIDVDKVIEMIKSVDGVLDTHDLHIWAITKDKINLTAHILLAKNSSSEKIIIELQELLKTQFNICHTTFQQEYEHCLEDFIH